MAKFVVLSTLLAGPIMAGPLTGMCRAAEAPSADARLQWWNQARFGMFIHWGLYSMTAGDWEGRPDPHFSCWDMERLKIPLGKYVALKDQFNPVKFNADAVARLAKGTGMNYLVITAKHHDGFCLFDSAMTDFDIMGGPFRRDIIKELAEACRKCGLKFGVYYSILDWHHPDYVPRRPGDDRRIEGADFDRYVAHMKEQLRELLTKYGPISILWFDGEWDETWNTARGHDLYDYVRGLQPDILINNRVDKARRNQGNALTDNRRFAGDFGTPEQEIPPSGLPGVNWETCMTVNDTWGFKTRDLNWKSSATLIRMLIECASKGGNFLLNIDPMANGGLPEPSVTRFKDIGAWMDANGSSIYGTTASPFPKRLPWGYCTTRNLPDKKQRLYLHVTQWPDSGKIAIPALEGKPEGARLLVDDAAHQLPLSRVDDEIVIDIGVSAAEREPTVILLDVRDS